MHHIGGMEPFEVFTIAERLLLHDLVDSRHALEQGFPLFKGQQRITLVGHDRLVGQHADHDPAQLLRLAQESNVPAVQHVRGEAHVHRAAFDLMQLRLYLC